MFAAGSHDRKHDEPWFLNSGEHAEFLCNPKNRRQMKCSTDTSAQEFNCKKGKKKAKKA
jgi:hypothetical protein